MKEWFYTNKARLLASAVVIVLALIVATALRTTPTGEYPIHYPEAIEGGSCTVVLVAAGTATCEYARMPVDSTVIQRPLDCGSNECGDPEDVCAQVTKGDGSQVCRCLDGACHN